MVKFGLVLWLFCVNTAFLAALEITEAQFRAADRNRDGQVTAAELPRKRLFRFLDRNKDGIITREEVGLAEPDAAPLVLAPSVLPRQVAPGIGQYVADFTCQDLDGRTWRLQEMLKKGLVVLVLRDPDCPVAAKYAPALKRLSTELAKAGVQQLFVHIGDTEAGAKADRQAHAFQGVYIHDVDAKLASLLQAQTTTESFVIDAKGVLRYRGAINDQYGIGWSQGAARYHFLHDAVRALQAGRLPTVQATRAPGCNLDLRPNRTSGTVTWNEHIAPIIANNCVVCHQEGGAGPFALQRYEDVSGRRKGMIASVVEEGVMPPWYADAKHGSWANDRRLAKSEREQLLAWVEAGCPKGEGEAVVAQAQQQEGWQIGKPDLILDIPRTMTIPAEGVVPYVNVTVKNPLKKDMWVEAYEIRPTAPAVVHHVLVFIDDEFQHTQGGLHGFFAGMVPGQNAVSWNPGFAKKLPARANLRFQLHYTTNGKRMRDRTRIGFRFAKQKPQHEIVTKSAANARFQIPPGAKAHQVVGERRFKRETVLLAFMPHMHVRGTAYSYELIDPNGKRQMLLSIPRYDFNWQLRYQLAKPLRVAAGSRLRTIGTYDNSAANPANPDPGATVRYGEQTWDEMQIGYWEGYER